jgi:hypothetical protein
MLHALDQRTLENFMPNLAPLPDQATKDIYSSNVDYFHRGAVHVLAEQLKGDGKIKGQTFAKHIVYRYELFQKMMVMEKKPAGGKDDPVTAYGWNWDNTEHMAKLQKLQDQHKDVALRCYLWGYKHTKPEWDPFLNNNPTYWFKVYAGMLLSTEYKHRWLTQLVDRPEEVGKLSPKDEILIWGNKLSMLKAAAPASDQASLNVEKITEMLNGESQQKLAYAQLLNNAALQNLDEVSLWISTL